MIDHVSLSVSDLRKSRDFYVAALKPLDYSVVYDIEDILGWGLGISGFSIGQGGETRLWLDGDSAPVKTHIAFGAKTREEVAAFYTAALEAGGTDNGAPGIREQYGPNYYAAFVYDPDGNNIEVVCRT
jgi:catechol 2,3-dioxygenase-like lactoylglutathione lyase family enzyme